MTFHSQYDRRAFSLLELISAVTILGVLAAIALPRISQATGEGHRTACHVLRAEVELQAQRWHRVNGSYPSTALTAIGTDVDFFPEGLPICPVDGSAYTLDTATGKVNGHNH